MKKNSYEQNSPQLTKRDYIPRQNIYELLESGITKPLITVQAGAGFGKTFAVSGFFSSSEGRIVWVQLCELDNLTERFWDAIIREVALLNSELAEILKSQGFPDTLDEVNRCLDTIEEHTLRERRAVVILDDFHLIKEERIIWFLEHILQAKPRSFCLILISRKPIPLRVSALINYNQWMRITMEELRFSYRETRDYVRLLGGQLNEDQLGELHQITEGWPCSIAMVAKELIHGEEIGKQWDSSTLSDVFELIEYEVFSEYTPDVRRMLGRLAYLESYEADLVHTLAGDMAGILQELTKNNMFLDYNAHTGQYLFHHLFLEYLRSIYQPDEEERGSIYRTMGEWYAKHHRQIRALSCYWKAQEYQCCWDIIRIIGVRQCSKEIAEQLIELLDKIPDDFWQSKTLMLLIKAKLLINNYRLEESMTILQAVEKQLIPLKDQDSESRTLLMETYIIMAMHSYCRREKDIAGYLDKAVKYLTDTPPALDYSSKLFDGNYAVVMPSFQEGELQRMKELFYACIPYSTKLFKNISTARAHLYHAEAAYYTSDFDEAVTYASKAIYQGHDAGNAYVIGLGCNTMIRVAVARGDYEMMADYVKKLQQCSSNIEDKSDCPIIVDLTLGWLYCILNQMDKVASWIIDDKLNQEVIPPVSTGRDRIVRAKYMLYQNKYQEVLTFLQNSDELFRERKILPALLYSKIIQAIASHYLKYSKDALRFITEAYQMAAGNKLEMMFMEFGLHIRTLFGSIRKTKCDIPEEWIEYIFTKSNTYAKRVAFLRSEYNRRNQITTTGDFGLSYSEKKILSELCQGLTRSEIAEENYISLNTVKSSIKAIYSKLGADTLAEAIHIALSEGLI